MTDNGYAVDDKIIRDTLEEEGSTYTAVPHSHAEIMRHDRCVWEIGMSLGPTALFCHTHKIVVAY